MGKGDKKTRRGKLFKGSFGKTRPAKPNKKKAATTKQG
ncbi:MAG: 30S ribosomal protein THX [Chitinophagaceae bacterium]|nr:30S ribosomal protein THX [Chitinophagaceae bacterium]MBD0333037.1 30S ribosomal protein THX [Chitinophagaceae bacterium]